MILDWIIKNWIEVTATIIGITYLFLSIRQNIWLWLFGLLTSALYIYVFWESKFYADMLLQIYYVAISIYGWIHWYRGSTNTKNLSISSSGKMLMIVLLASWLILWAVMSAFLTYFTDSEVPIGDGFTTAGSIVATWMLARKIKEHWIFWVIIDFVSLILYIDKELYSTSVLFVIYTVMAIVGYIEWNRNYQKKPILQTPRTNGLQREEADT